MCYIHAITAVPNKLIIDPSLHYTTKKVAVTLALLSGKKHRCVKITFARLASFSHCSIGTARQAIDELIDFGFLEKKRTYRYGTKQNYLIYDANCYYLLPQEGGYTLIRREILEYQTTAATFNALIFLYQLGSRQGRAWPSLRHIAGLLKGTKKKGLAMAKSTVCAAIKALTAIQAIIRLRCKTKRGCFAASSYLLTNVKSCQEKSSDLGSPIFDKPIYNTQITEDVTREYILRGEDKGISIFVRLPKNDTLYRRITAASAAWVSTSGGQCGFDLWYDYAAPLPHSIPPP